MAEQRRRGRPPLAEGQPSTPVNVRVTGKDYDAAFARARRDRTSVPAVVRRALSKYLRNSDDEDDSDD